MAPVDPSLGAESYCYLTTTGRVTGEPREIEIWFALEGDTVYMREPRVTVRIGEVTFEGRARAIDDPDEDALARRLLPEKYRPRYGGDLDDWRERSLPIAIDLDA